MKQKLAYTVGILALALALGAGCSKRTPPPAPPPAPPGEVEDLAAWIPEEMEGLVVVSSLEELKGSWEVVRGLLLSPGKELLEAIEEETQTGLGLQLFALSTWQEMGINLQAPLALSFSTDKSFAGIVAVPVLSHAPFVAAIEKHLMKGEGEAQPTPQGMHAWKKEGQSAPFIVVEKPGYALVLLGEDMEALQKFAQLSPEKSWAQHKALLQQSSLRLPSERALSLWWKADESIEKVLPGTEWISLGLRTRPNIKLAVDLTWRPGAKPLLPKTEAVASTPEGWWGGEKAMGWLWSAVPWSWYTQLLEGPQLAEQLSALSALSQFLRPEFKPPFLARGWAQPGEEEGALRWSIDVALGDGSGMGQAMALASALLEGQKGLEQPNPEVPTWRIAVKEEAWWLHLKENKLRLTNSEQGLLQGEPDALQKRVLQEMFRYPLAAAVHLDSLEKHPLAYMLREVPLKKTGYVLLGLSAEEGHAQLVAEHFAEAGI